MKQLVRTVLALTILASCGGQDAKQETANAGGHEHHGETAMQPMEGKPDYADSVNAGYIVKDTLKGSPARMAMANIGRSHVHIEYSSPGTKDRVIWGGLVPYGTVWVTGAHSATTINFSKDIHIQGQPIKAGTYAFFTVPGKDKWIVILNTRFDQHLADQYNQQEDVARFEVVPTVSDKVVQRLNYTVTKLSDTSGSINMEWEKIRITLPASAK
ncbi:DUF2911 domain-containing protein [Paraflavitalea soli]|uniref:DUF2911 domain-containing protein n=1 Tax=Paraflavitalea soli TaxID=2315862 RepID=A0A3B7MJ22_9BACT|nr:DUF2911 domain-containing protein [Paraflavitalea soli]AXY74198.1 DUF2911 domain-containing protein [Paraflavitalea soli]